MGGKSGEYSRNDDKLHNFKRAAGVLGTTPEKALLGMMTKHTVSILDIVDDLEKDKLPSAELLAEKIGDELKYLILLKALIMERIIAQAESRKFGTAKGEINKTHVICQGCGSLVRVADVLIVGNTPLCGFCRQLPAKPLETVLEESGTVH